MKIRKGGGGDAMMRFIEAHRISRQPTLYTVSQHPALPAQASLLSEAKLCPLCLKTTEGALKKEVRLNSTANGPALVK